jgi:ribonuclease P protein component
LHIMGEHSFGKRERIRKRRDYLSIYQQGERFYSDHFIIVMHRNQEGVKRLGITASKKVGNAARRNRTKRLIREFFRRNKRIFRDSEDIVVIAKRAVPLLSYEDVYGELRRLFMHETEA